MPVLSMFYGIIIRMQSEKGGKHHVPHIHVICGDDESVFSLDGEKLEGTIQNSKMKLVAAWIEIHKEELKSDWKLLEEGEQPFKIEPLKQEQFMLRPTVTKAIPRDDYNLLLEFNNGEKKSFDVKPYIKGSWFGMLKDTVYFSRIKTNGFSIEWPDGQDICPDDLYFNSVAID